MRVEKRSEADMPAEAAAHQAFTSPLCEAVRARRHLGMKQAIYEVARFFGLPERRVKAAVYGEIRQVLAGELVLVQRRMADYLDAEARRLEAQAAILRARRSTLGSGDAC